MSNEAVNYSSIPIEYNQTDVDRSTRGNKTEEGWYKFQLVDAIAEVSKNKGSMMFRQDIVTLDEAGNAVGKPLRNYMVLPLVTPRSLLTAAGFPENFIHKAPNTAGLVRGYLEATRPTEFPHELRFDKAEKQWYHKDVAIDKDAADTIKRANATKLYEFITKAWANPLATFSGDTFYARVSYQEGRDFPSVGNISSALPEGEVLVAL